MRGQFLMTMLGGSCTISSLLQYLHPPLPGLLLARRERERNTHNATNTTSHTFRAHLGSTKRYLTTLPNKVNNLYVKRTTQEFRTHCLFSLDDSLQPAPGDNERAHYSQEEQQLYYLQTDLACPRHVQHVCMHRIKSLLAIKVHSRYTRNLKKRRHLKSTHLPHCTQHCLPQHRLRPTCPLSITKKKKAPKRLSPRDQQLTHLCKTKKEQTLVFCASRLFCVGYTSCATENINKPIL